MEHEPAVPGRREPQATAPSPLVAKVPSPRTGEPAAAVHGPTRSTGHRRRSSFHGLAVETAALLVLLSLYRWGRRLADGRHAVAEQHAEDLWGVQRLLHLPFELTVQHAFLGHPLLGQVANGYYAGVHFPLTAAVLGWLFIRRPEIYRATRTTLIAVTAAGLLIAFAYPLAPPRMMTGLGFTDVAALHGQSVYGGAVGGTSNQFAAMPSLHVGWAVLLAFAMSRATPTRRLRWIWWAHPVVTVLVVVGTGNHFWMDGLVGILLVTVSWSWLARARSGAEFRRRTLGVVLAATGFVTVLLGLVLVPLPGPGWVVVFAGLSLLGRRYVWARRARTLLQDRLVGLGRWFAGLRWPLRILVSMLTVVLTPVGTWACVALVGLPGWLPRPWTSWLVVVPGW